MKRYRQAAILDLVTFEVIGSQDELRRQLRAKGFNATQATISRDIKELRLIKRSADGSYGKSTDLVGNRVHNATEVRSSCWYSAPTQGWRNPWRLRSIARSSGRWSGRWAGMTRFW